MQSCILSIFGTAPILNPRVDDVIVSLRHRIISISPCSRLQHSTVRFPLAVADKLIPGIPAWFTDVDETPRYETSFTKMTLFLWKILLRISHDFSTGFTFAAICHELQNKGHHLTHNLLSQYLRKFEFFLLTIVSVILKNAKLQTKLTKLQNYRMSNRLV